MNTFWPRILTEAEGRTSSTWALEKSMTKFIEIIEMEGKDTGNVL